MKATTSRRFPLTCLALVLSSFSLLTAAERKVQSKVISATVYADRALITRRGQEQIPAGEHTLVFGNLPVTLQDQSVRVSGVSEGQARIIEVKIETVFPDTIPEERIRDFQERLKNLRTDQQSLTNRVAVLNSQRLFIDSLRVSYAREVRSGVQGQRTGVEDWERMLAFVEKNLTAVYAKIQDTQAKLETVKEKIQAVEREIQNSGAYSRKSLKVVQVRLSIPRAGSVTLDVSYVLYGASWVPLYEARVSGDAKNLQFGYAAQVRQNTSEDWTNVDLTLSTSRPSEGGTAPQLFPWFVDVLQPMPVPVSAGLMKQRPQVKAEAAEPPSEVAEDAETIASETATVESQATSVVFRIPSKSTIPSDNDPHRVTIAAENLPAEFSYISVPKHAPSAYLKAKAKNSSEYPFLAGTMNVFFENTFVATSQLRTVLPGEEFETGLGVDEGIRIERKLVNRFTESTGTFTSKKKITYDFIVKVENTKKVKVDLAVQDQVPISRNEKIVVEVINPSSKELQPDENGFLKWNLGLNPREKRELKLKFSIEFPSDLNVSGLE